MKILILLVSVLITEQFLLPIESNNEQRNLIFKKSNLNFGQDFRLNQIEKCFSVCYQCNSDENHLEVNFCFYNSIKPILNRKLS
jgi:hypothetical protein